MDKKLSLYNLPLTTHFETGGGINLRRSQFKDYRQIIKILGNRYRRVMRNPKIFLTWYKQNKDTKEFPRFLMWMIKKLYSQNKTLYS